MKYPGPFLALLSLCLFSRGTSAEKTSEPSAVPIFLPYYESKSWSLVRGSIVTSDAEETTFTVFCAPQTPPNCDLALDFPFVFVENNETLRFEGTLTSTFTANLECQLGGTTAATCSAYSSLKSGYTAGLYTGPTEISWTSTLSGSEVQWATLTLADRPSDTKTLDISGTAMPTPEDDNTTDDFIFDGTLPTGTEPLPTETNPSAGSQIEKSQVLIWSLTGLLLAGFLL